MSSFFSETSIHGFQYLLRGRAAAERAVWAAVIASCFAYTAYTIRQSLHSWSTRPTETTIDTVSRPIREIPFPAVTVCPASQSAVGRWDYVESVLNLVAHDGGSIGDLGAPARALARKIVNDTKAFLWESGGVGDCEPGWQIVNLAELEVRITEPCPFEDVLQPCLRVGGCASLLQGAGEAGEIRRSDLDRYIAGLEDVAAELFGAVTYDRDEEEPYEALVAFAGEMIYPRAKSAGVAVGEDFEENFEYAMCYFYAREHNTGCTLGLKHFSMYLRSLERLFSRYPGRLGTLARSSLAAGAVTSAQEIKFHGALSGILPGLGGRGDDDFGSVSPWDLAGLMGKMSLFSLRTRFDDSEGLVRAFRSALEPFGGGLPNCSILSNASGDDLGKPSLTEAWADFLAGKRSDPPCSGDAGVCCATFGRIFSRENLGVFAELAKLAMRMPPPDKAHVVPHQSVMDNLRARYKLEDFSAEEGPRSSIPLCYVGAESTATCSLFRPAFTNDGLCFSFNGLAPDELFKGGDALLGMLGWENTNRTLFHPRGHGQQHGFVVVLDLHANDPDVIKNARNGGGPAVGFKAVFGAPEDAPDLFGAASFVRPGYMLEARVRAERIVATEGLRDVAVESRGCLFEDESDGLELFATYTMANCNFECSMKKAEEKCGCRPWNYPGTGNNLCDYFGNSCFDREMNDVSSIDGCDCPYDCQGTRYSVSVAPNAVSPDLICGDEENGSTWPELRAYIMGEVARPASGFAGAYAAWAINATSAFDPRNTPGGPAPTS